MDCSTPGFPVLHHLPELAQAHVHWDSDAIQPSCPLSSPSPAFNLSQHQDLYSKDLAICIRWSKHWSFSFRIRPSNEYSQLIYFRIDWFDLLAVQGTLKSLLQHHSSNASAFSLLYGPTLPSVQDYGKNHSLDYTDFCRQSNVCFLICCLDLS